MSACIINAADTKRECSLIGKKKLKKKKTFLNKLKINISFYILSQVKEFKLDRETRFHIFRKVNNYHIDSCDACDERGNFEGCRYACFLSVADVGLFYRS